MTHLKEYFYSIIPETLYSDGPVVKDILDVFLEYVEEKIVPIYSLEGIFDLSNTLVKEELLKTYISDLYEIFNATKTNKIITRELQLVMDGMGIEYNAYASTSNIVNILTTQHIKGAKAYKQKKGTKFAIEYVYNLIKNSGMQPFGIDKTKNDFVFNLDDQEYHFNNIEGSLIHKIYHNIVAYATHPVGFTYNYEMKTVIELIDYFGYVITYINKSTYITCDLGVTDFTNRTIVSINRESDDWYVKITFQEGDYIVKNGLSLIHYNDNETINTDFTGCVLTYDFDISLTPTTYDIVEFTDEDYICNWFDINGTSKSAIGLPYNYIVGEHYMKGIIGLSPFVLCELTSFRQHLVNGTSLYASSDELLDIYHTTPYEIQITGKCNDNIECDGYGIVCDYADYNTEVCNKQLAFDGLLHQPGIDNIEVELIE